MVAFLNIRYRHIEDSPHSPSDAHAAESGIGRLGLPAWFSEMRHSWGDMQRIDADRRPIIIGVGEIKDRPQDMARGLEPAMLMRRALQYAEADSGARLLGRLDSLDVVNQQTWRYRDLPALLAEALDARPAWRRYGDIGGNTPLQFLHEAALRIAKGESDLAAVVGGEATYTAAWARRNGVALQWTAAEASDFAAGAYFPKRDRNYLAPLARRHGLEEPIAVYPLYENATVKHWGLTPAEAGAESAMMWASLSEVAAQNPNAWIGRRYSMREIAEIGAGNRPIAWPYSKLLVANPAVNQGGAFILASVAAARALGIPRHRWLYVWGGGAAAEPRDWMARDQFYAAPAQEVVMERLLAICDGEIGRFGAIELYSCFPCLPKMARRKLGLAMNRSFSVAGGLTFHGAPLNNYMTHAVAATVRRLRQAPDVLGLLYGQGGAVTAHHGIVVSADEPEIDDYLFDWNLQHEADRRRSPAPQVEADAMGEAMLETFTVIFDREGAVSHGAAVLRLPNGGRSLGRIGPDDKATLTTLMERDRSPIGRSGRLFPGEGGLMHWSL